MTRKRRHSAIPKRTRTITTHKKRRHDPVRQPTVIMTTLCFCGKVFTPSRSNQMYHSERCRQSAYEQTAKGSARRSKYWKSDKGKATLGRYRETGAAADNSRTYRYLARDYASRLHALSKKIGYRNVTFALLFGDSKNQIPVKAAYRMYHYWCCSHRRGSTYEPAVRVFPYTGRECPEDRLYTELRAHLGYTTRAVA